MIKICRYDRKVWFLLYLYLYNKTKMMKLFICNTWGRTPCINDRIHLTNALIWWNRSLVIQTIMSIGWISEKSGNFGITFRSAKASTNKPAATVAAVALTFENARRSITKRYNGAVYYLNNEKPSNGIAARRGGVLPRTLLIFPAVVSLYVEISRTEEAAA